MKKLKYLSAFKVIESMNMSKDKQKALKTLEKVKEIYDNEGGDLLCGGFWTDFMAVVNSQIAEIIETTK